MAVHRYSGARVSVSAGIYYFQQLLINSASSTLVVPTTGIVRIYVASQLAYRGQVVTPAGQAAQIVLGYNGTSAAVLEASFGLPTSARQRSMFAEGIAHSRVRLAMAVDMPFERRTGRIGLRPFAEYHLEIVTARPDPAFEDLTPANRDQQWLTLGLRAHVGARVIVNVGSDLLIRSVGFPFGPPLPPYQAFVGMAIPVALGTAAPCQNGSNAPLSSSNPADGRVSVVGRDLARDEHDEVRGKAPASAR